MKNKILFVILVKSEFQRSMVRALESFGWFIEVFDWHDYLPNNLWNKIQCEYLIGPVIKKVNNALVKTYNITRPDVVFIYKGIYVFSKTLKYFKSFGSLVISYNPDNPFGNFDYQYAKKYKIINNPLLSKLIAIKKGIYYKRLWTNYIKTIPLYDINFVPRKSQILDYLKIGAREVHLLYWHYVPELHHPIKLSDDDIERFDSDVVFIGRYEPDDRRDCIEALIDTGYHVRLFGTGWDYYLTKKMRNVFGKSIHPVYGMDYTKAICASKIVLNFNAKLNKDTSTIRCIEIPACGGLLLSERSEELLRLFKEDKEAVYFSNSNELLEKVNDLLNNHEKRKTIALSGYNKCISSGHDVYSRMREWDSIIYNKLKDLNILQ